MMLRLTLAWVLLVLTCWPLAAFADDRAAATALFEDGRALMDAGDYPAACAKLEQSLALDDALGTLLNLALCNEKRGKTATAWAQFTSAAERAFREKHPDRETFAKTHVLALEPRLSRITLRHPDPAEGTKLTIDGRAFGVGMVGTPLPIDPGLHSIEVTAPKHDPWRDDVTVAAEGAHLIIDVPPLEPTKPAVPPPPVPAPELPPLVPDPKAPASPLPGSNEPGIGWTVASYGLIGVGSATLVAGIIAGVVSIVRGDDLTGRCIDGVCPPSAADSLSRAQTSALVANVTIPIGATLGAVGLVLVLVTGGDPEVGRWSGTGFHF